MTQSGINEPMRRRNQYLSIQQQKINRSLITQSDLLHQLDPDVHDFSTIQELYLDSNHNSRANHHWFMVYPKEHYVTPSWTRSLILVNRWLASNTWSQVDIYLSDVMAIAINTGIGKVLLINMYNDMGQQHSLMCSI